MFVMSDEDVKTIISRATNCDAQILGYRLDPFTKQRNGLLGDHYLLSVEIKVTPQDEKVYTFFVKTPTESSVITDIMMDDGTFEEEEIFYNKVQPLMLEYYKGERWSAKCYLAKPGILVFEDLRSQGFIMRTENVMDEKILKAGLTSLGRFHACSILAEKKLGKPLNKVFPNSFQEKMYSQTNKFGRGTKVGFDTIIEMANRLNLDSRLVPKIFERVKQSVKPKEGDVNVVCHSDLWKNNLLFNNENNVKCILVDFQILRYASFSCDLGMFLYLNTTPEYRKKSEIDMFRHYYSSFSEALQNSKVKVVIPSYEKMLNEYNDHKLVGMSYASLHLPVIYFKPEDFAVLLNDPIVFEKWYLHNRMENVEPYLNSDPVYTKAVKNILNELLMEAKRIFIK